MKIRHWAALSAVCAILAGCGDAPAALEGEDAAEEGTEAVPADWPESLTLTLQPTEDASELLDDAEVLGGLLEDALGVPVEFEVPTDVAAAITALGSGQVDIGGGFGPLDVARAMDRVDAEPILQAERFGEFLYVSQWFTNDPDTYCGHEPVAEPHEVEGETYTFLYCNGVDELESAEQGPIGLEFLEQAGNAHISFVAEGSAAGQLFPALGLVDAGFDLGELDTEFAGGHPESVLSVYHGERSIGVSYDDAREDLVTEFPDIGEQVVVFAWSEPIPNDGFVVRGDLPDTLKQAIAEALIAIADDEGSREVLSNLYDVDGFRPADPDDFRSAREVDARLDELLDR